MYKKNLFSIILVAFLILPFSIICGQKIINASDFGIIPGKSNITPFVRTMLDSLQTKGAVEIHFQKGVYHFYPEEARGKYHCITNHSNLYRYFAFPLIGFSNITIDGCGSDFIFHGLITPFVIENSSEVRLRNFNIDWEVPFFFQAEIIKRDTVHRTYEIFVDKKFSNFEYKTGRLRLKGEKWKFEYLGQNIVFDPKTKAVAYRAEDCMYFGNDVYVEMMGQNHFKLLWNETPSLPKTGEIITFRGAMFENRIAPAFHLNNSSNIAISDVNVYHCAGSAFVAEKCKDIYLNRFNVKLRENSERFASAMADAIHICNCKGQLVVENGLFENMLDDGINVHGTYMQINKIINQKAVIAGLKHFQQTEYQFASSGDSIQFINDSTLLPVGYGVVDKFERINENLCKLTFKNNLPYNVKINYGLDNISWYPETFIYRNNVVRNNRARAILVSSRGKCIIENNSISTMKNAILVEGDLNHWFESGAITNLIIRNNTFGNTSYGGGNFPTISINPQIKLHEQGKFYEKNIHIDNNTFNVFNSNLLFANSVNGLKITGNIFTKTSDYADYANWQSAFKIINSKNVIIKDNTLNCDFPNTVKVDSETKRGIKSDIKLVLE